MRKSSRSISLALIGSALVIVAGCAPQPEENEWSEEEEVAQVDGDPNLQGVATANGQYNNSGGGGMGRTASGIGGAMIGSQIGRSLGRGMSSGPGYGGGGGSSASPSSRGGFGSSAGGFGSSGSASS